MEIIGWLYQFYIAEKKDEVMARKKAVPTEDIPAVTQLFTPHWIVRYLVENSLGRVWLLNRPGSRLRELMPFYIEGEAETDFLKITKPEEIKLLDPACGSGHMLTYAFDLLTLIYEEEGYSPSEISGLILQHNLYGLEIYPRAAQLTELALLFKAREKSRRFFYSEQLVRPQVLELQNIYFTQDELNAYIEALDLGELFDFGVYKLLQQFEEAKNLGSLIQPCLDERAIAPVRRAIEAKDLGGQLILRETHLKVLRVLEQAEALTQRYHFVVANPPYMGGKSQSASLAAFLSQHYASGKKDLFSSFALRALSLIRRNVIEAQVVPYVWMFISSFEAFRREIWEQASLSSLVRLEYNAFEPACVPVCLYVLKAKAKSISRATFIDLDQFKGHENQSPRLLEAIDNSECSWRYKRALDDIAKLPGGILAFWLPESLIAMLGTSKCLVHDGRKRG